MLEQLLTLWIKKGKCPDILSKEYEPNVIMFEWYSGRIKIFPYNEKQYNAVWDLFNDYWKRAEF